MTPVPGQPARPHRSYTPVIVIGALVLVVVCGGLGTLGFLTLRSVDRAAAPPPPAQPRSAGPIYRTLPGAEGARDLHARTRADLEKVAGRTDGKFTYDPVEPIAGIGTDAFAVSTVTRSGPHLRRDNGARARGQRDDRDQLRRLRRAGRA